MTGYEAAGGHSHWLIHAGKAVANRADKIGPALKSIK